MLLSKLKNNPSNPRIIKDNKFEKLCENIKRLPKMLSLRPIIVDDDNMVLGGNMRLAALKELGYDEIPNEWVKKASELTEDEKRQFIILDNASFGDWDWDLLANNWSDVELGDWGVDVWQPEEEGDEWSGKENASDEEWLDKYLNKETGVLKLSFLQEQYKEVVSKLDDIQDDLMLDNHSETFLKILEAYENLQYKKG